MKLHGKNCINYYSMICYMFAGKEEGKKKPSKHQLKIVSTEKEPWWMSTKTNLSQFLSQNTLADLNKK